MRICEKLINLLIIDIEAEDASFDLNLNKRPINEDMSKSDRCRFEFVKDESILTHELLKVKTRKWLSLYKSVYEIREITPYMHILTSHLHELMEIHGDLNLFNQEGFEKKNDIVRMNYFSSSNKHLQSFKQQILKKCNRIDYINNVAENSDEEQ